MSFGEEFLARPDSFPSIADTKSWGSRTIGLDIAGTTPIAGLSSAQLETIRTQYREYLAAPCDANHEVFSISVHRLPTTAFRRFDRRGWESTLDMSYSPLEVRVAGYGFVGRIDLAANRNSTLWTAEDGDRSFSIYSKIFFASSSPIAPSLSGGSCCTAQVCCVSKVPGASSGIPGPESRRWQGWRCVRASLYSAMT